MGQSYFTCDVCDHGFSDHDENHTSCECGAHFCSKGCAIFFEDFGEDEDNSTCVICRKEKATDKILLNALLKHYKITQNQAFEIYRDQE